MQRARLGTFDVAVASSRRERRRGLLGQAGLPAGRGLLLPRCRSVHTFGMRFPIEAVLLDAGYRVVDVVHLPPGRFLLPRRGVRHVLEIAVGDAPAVGSLLSPTRPER